MNSIQENVTSMMFKIRTFFASHLATFSTAVPSLSDAVDEFNDTLDELGDHEMEAIEDISGYALQKENYRIAMRDKAVGVSGGLKAYALDAGNEPLAGKAVLLKSTIDNERDTHALYLCNKLFELATDHAAAIIPFGITSLKLAALSTAITNYKNCIENPQDQRSESAAAGRGVDICLVKLNALLVKIDGMMATQAEDEPVLYYQYTLDRLIDDNSSNGGSNPVATVTVPANSYMLVYNIAYSATRSFRVKNNGDNPLNWGLSTEPNSFSNPQQTLDPHSESTYMSTTLGPNGDNLLFQNPHPTDAIVDVWVIE